MLGTYLTVFVSLVLQRNWEGQKKFCQPQLSSHVLQLPTEVGLV
jgi:hypothetical protein